MLCRCNIRRSSSSKGKETQRVFLFYLIFSLKHSLKKNLSEWSDVVLSSQPSRPGVPPSFVHIPGISAQSSAAPTFDSSRGVTSPRGELLFSLRSANGTVFSEGLENGFRRRLCSWYFVSNCSHRPCVLYVTRDYHMSCQMHFSSSFFSYWCCVPKKSNTSLISAFNTCFCFIRSSPVTTVPRRPDVAVFTQIASLPEFL